MKENKQNKVLEVLTVVLEACLLLMITIGMFRSCAVHSSSSNVNGVASNATPSCVIDDKKEALLNPIEDNNTVVINNYTSQNVRVSYTNSHQPQVYYGYTIAPGETYDAYYNGGSDDALSFTASSDFYLVSDDINVNDYGSDSYFIVENFNGTYINIYDKFTSYQPIYFDTHFDMRLQTMKPFLLEEMPNTAISRVYGYSVDLGTDFRLDFTDDYINAFNDYHRLLLEYHIIPSKYGYTWYADLFAYGNYQNTIIHTLLATTRVFSNPQIGRHDSNRIGFNVFGDNWTAGDNLLLVPYLKSSKLTPSGNIFKYVADQDFDSGILIRPLLLQNAPLKENRIRMTDLSEGDFNLWADFGDLLTVVLVSFLPIASIRLLPFISIGAMVIAPLLVMLVMFILRLFKK